MTDATPDALAAAPDKRLDRLKVGLRRRHAREQRFKWYGRIAIKFHSLCWFPMGAGFK